MLLVRPARFSDLPEIEQLSIYAGSSMTTLPNNRDHLAELINATSSALQQDVWRPGAESYHFVLEDTLNQQVLGIAGIEACVGKRSPFYSYRCDELEHHSSALQIHSCVPTLHLCRDYEGHSRLFTFYIRPDAYAQYQLELLSLSRLLFIASQRERFSENILVELQGARDEQQQSPFWQALGRHFYNMDLHRANYLTGINDKGFIADLMPRHPVYVPLLTESAQQAIGQLRPDRYEIAELLEQQGFARNNYVSIFDAGPTFEAATQTLATIRDCQQLRPDIGSKLAEQGQMCIVSNEKLLDFRAILVATDPQKPRLTADQAQMLKLEEEDPINLYALQHEPMI
ncbi:MAG: arginine N-succinyltransferase [Pseudomonadales bacterium]